ncbi:hypothetical protein HJG60_012110 [Phyllostomus discolor]|uniref:Uncharacterized protein n=1 Tax=Phyllostomus discolor TaxID=89673 RepID=A0A833ZLZ4_9CHIR|nr:hypothetical protein HJG60_012110 [Phyllostomus discolor]
MHASLCSYLLPPLGWLLTSKSPQSQYILVRLYYILPIGFSERFCQFIAPRGGKIYIYIYIYTHTHSFQFCIFLVGHKSIMHIISKTTFYKCFKWKGKNRKIKAEQSGFEKLWGVGQRNTQLFC